MSLNCSYCRATNEIGSLFCKNCGNAFAVKQSRKNSIALPLIIIGSILAVCSFCGLFGLIDNRRESSTVPAANVKTLVGAHTTENKATTSALNTAPADDEQMATVIAENVNLRKTNSAKSEVVETLPKDSVIEVVKQSGAWFYVRAIGGQSGWLHGNAIRLKNGENTNAVPPPENKPAAETYSAPRVTSSAPEPAINNSGATAKCRDGSLSYSAHRRGTCSHHGGVAVWY